MREFHAMERTRLASTARTSFHDLCELTTAVHAFLGLNAFHLAATPASTSRAFLITATFAAFSHDSLKNCTIARNTAATISTSWMRSIARTNVPPRLSACAAAPATQMSIAMGKKSRDAIRIVSLITCRALSSPTIAGPAGAAYGSIFSAGFSSFSSVGVSSNVSASVVVAGEGGVSAASSRGKARKDEEDVVRGRLELDHVVALMRSRGSRFPRGRRPGAADAARADADARGARDARIAILATRARPAHETRSILGGARENDERARANITSTWTSSRSARSILERRRVFV